ncbi:carboxymuconolactone decarboxylase family protein [Methanobacterium alkalithermotolerans]|uniref:Carboxymuconolactone decarboxylase family protein n=1 Tax=Methanobacterium alkalithermotolerans TaxID=2731220 RepID=A0A8T8K3A1_9EURY|nr:carboxymuconolactone decarboxylase family protein [Methanobacterium alkalithermotolerans]QUH22447.1 carboxymuconolactone decarboxylase family protein [Methanobacterium alkalithermotolerans]
MKKDKPRPYQFAKAINGDLEEAFNNLSFQIMKDGALSTREKTLIALACAVAVKCKQCIKAHEKKAQEEGCSREEILEAAAVAGQVRLGSGFTFASYLLEE